MSEQMGDRASGVAAVTSRSDHIERSGRTKGNEQVRTSSVVNRQRLALEPLQSVNAVTPNPKLRSACATDPSSKTANTTDASTRGPLFAPNGAALLFTTVTLRYDACLLINTWIQPVTNEADVLSESCVTDRGDQSRKGDTPHCSTTLCFYICGFARNSIRILATVRPRSPTPRQAPIS
jgi:hypothetical protein